jgi:hypothetical protein
VDATPVLLGVGAAQGVVGADATPDVDGGHEHEEAEHPWVDEPSNTYCLGI